MSNKEIVLAFYRTFEQGNWEKARTSLSPAVKATVGPQALGLAEWEGMGRMFMEAFPDGRHVWDHVETAGDLVVLQGNFTGTHEGPFMGIPASGHAVKFSTVQVNKVIDGKIVEHRGDFDSAALMQQIAPEAASRAVIDAFMKRVDAQDWDGARSYIASNATVEMGTFKGDREGWVGMGQMFAAGFPDGAHTIEETIATGDRIVALGHWNGTHRGEFQGVPATGKRCAITFVQTFRVQGGKIVGCRGEFDAAGLMQQLTQS
jgi:predicted ester cyclase